jgi:hypothetical protein
MFIELLDTLRCVADHPQIPLVTAISRREDRFVIDAISGCPTCRREYPIVSGSAWFRSIDDVRNADANAASGPYDPEAALRIAALLAVTDGISVALVGAWARYATELSGMLDLRVYAVNPRDALGESECVGVVHTNKRLPFADASMRGIAIGEAGWSEHELELAVRALAPGGRMLAPVSHALPHDIVQIAQDEHVWVGEKRGPLVALHRR